MPISQSLDWPWELLQTRINASRSRALAQTSSSITGRQSAAAQARQPRIGEARAHATFTSIAFGLTSTVLGTCTFSTPFLNSAVIRFISTSVGNKNRRMNFP